MHVYPKSAYAKLGFDVILERIRSLLKTEQGSSALDRLTPSSDHGGVRRRLDIADEVRNAIEFDDPVPHAGVSEISHLLERAVPEKSFLDGEELVEIRSLIDAFSTLKKYYDSRNERYPLTSGLFKDLEIDGALSTRLHSQLDPDGSVSDSASPELRRIRREKDSLQREIRTALTREFSRAAEAGYAADGQPTIRAGRHVMPIKVEGKRKVSGFIHDVSSTGQTVFIEPAACLDLNNELRTVEARERREIIRILTDLTDLVRTNSATLARTTTTAGKYDVFHAIGSFAARTGGTVPQLSEGKDLEIRDGLNPLLHVYYLDSGRSVVPLNLNLDECTTLVISGPNAGGKTVALKSAGLMMLMLACGIPVPADPTSRFPIPTQLFVDIGDEQSLEEDLSSYSSHLSRVREALENADATSVVLIDEIGAATDPEQGSAIALATLEALSKTGCLTIVTTHFGRLKTAAESAEGFCNASMEFDVDKLVPTYRFIQDIPGSSYAMEIATRVGLDDSLVDRSREILGVRESSVDELLARLEQEKKELEERAEDLKERLDEAAGLQKKYEAKMAKHSKEADAIKQRAVRESEQLLHDSRAEVERTIRIIKETGAAKKATQKARARLDSFTEDVEQKSRKLEATRENESSSPDDAGAIAIGDRVVVDDGSTTAEVLEIEGDRIIIASGVGRLTVDRARLRKVGGRSPQKVEIRTSAASSNIVAGTRTHIDLRGKRVDEALGDVVPFVDNAVASNLETVTILHGTGTGALRNAIREYLATRSDVASCDDAEWEAGGPGVTVISLNS